MFMHLFSMFMNMLMNKVNADQKFFIAEYLLKQCPFSGWYVLLKVQQLLAAGDLSGQDDAL